MTYNVFGGTLNLALSIYLALSHSRYTLPRDVGNSTIVACDIHLQ